MLKKLAALMCILLLPSLAFAETGTATFKNASFPLDSEYIDMGKTGVTPQNMKDFMAFLKKFPNLKKVDMFEIAMGKQRIEQLTSAFPDIEFGMTMVVGGEHKLRTDATAFSTLHGPNNPMHSNADFSVLKYCKNLYALDLGHNLISDLSFLYDLPKLRVLILAKNKLTDITPIASLHDLEYLELLRNDVADISPLAGLTHLVDLNITSNRISDLSPLRNLTNLRRLWVKKCHKYDDMQAVIRTQFQELREALPDTFIDDTHRGTDGAWRTVGTHYKTIKRMFASGQYEPFDDVHFDDYAYEFAPNGR